MQRVYYFFLLLGIILVFTNGKRVDKTPPSIHEGILDLSQWDFNKNGPVVLNGEWEFYRQQFLMARDFVDDPSSTAPPMQKELLKVPGIWNNYTGSKPIKGFGFATYRLKILLNPEYKGTLGFKFLDMGNAFYAYVNDDKIGGNGTPGKTKKTSVPVRKPFIQGYTPTTHSLDVILHISNFHHARGGAWNSIVLGDYEQLKRNWERTIAFDFSIFGSLLIMSLYHLGLFLVRKKDTSLLYFVLFCFFIGTRSMLIGNNAILPIMNWELQTKLEYALTQLVIIYWILYIKKLYPDECSVKTSRMFIGIASTLLIIVILTPCFIYSYTTMIMQIFVILWCFFLVYVMIKAYLNRRKGASFFLLSYIFLTLTIINDILVAKLILKSTYIVQYGMFAFIFAQGYYLTMRFLEAFKTAEHLSHNLRKEVDRRTVELQEQTRQAREANVQTEKTLMQLEEMSKQKNIFFMNLIHETRTPVTLIKNYLEMHLQKEGTSEELEIVHRNTAELERNMNNYLYIEKATTSRNKLFEHETIYDLGQLLSQITSLYPGDRIILNLDTGIMIKANAEAIKILIDNILINAIKYNTDMVTITIDLTKDEKNIVLTISDNGIGIAKDHQAHIFEPFYQVSHTKKNIQGIGLGLSLVRQIVESLAGDMELISDINQGVKYTITLPLYTGKENIAGPGTPPFIILEQPPKRKILEDPRYHPDRETILVIEDNRDTLSFLVNAFQEDYNVYAAENGYEALEKLHALQKNHCLPRIIISDIMMDRINGYDFLDRLKEHDDFSYIPVIFLTAKVQDEDRRKGYSRGAVAYFTKPFAIDTLKSAVKANIENRDALLEDVAESWFNESGFMQKCDEYALSPIQKKILKAWALENRSQPVIAGQLDRSVRMVEKHVRMIKVACGVDGVRDARMALRKLFKDYILPRSL